MWYLLNRFLKRFFDIVICSVAIVVLLPVWLLVAILIKTDSIGPVFFTQGRRTKGGRVFQMYKFRSMVVNAEHMEGGLFNFTGDPRVTKVGRWLRDTSIDELPQLWNVVKGDLSLVGPRPCVTYELGDFETLNKRYKKRFEVRGGITGLAQVMGRNVNTWDEKVTYDNLYIDQFKKQGILLDIKIIFGTVINVFRKCDICEEKADPTLNDGEAAKLAEEEIIRIAHLPDKEDAEAIQITG